MGTASSVIKDNSISVNLLSLSSDELRPCEICEKEVNLNFCEVCKKDLCVQCCEHLAQRENPFFILL